MINNIRYFDIKNELNNEYVKVSFSIEKLKSVREKCLKYSSIREKKHTTTTNLKLFKETSGLIEDLQVKKNKSDYTVEYTEVFKPYLYFLLSYLIEGNLTEKSVNLILNEIFLMDLTKEEDLKSELTRFSEYLKENKSSVSSVDLENYEKLKEKVMLNNGNKQIKSYYLECMKYIKVEKVCNFENEMSEVFDFSKLAPLNKPCTLYELKTSGFIKLPKEEDVSALKLK